MTAKPDESNKGKSIPTDKSYTQNTWSVAIANRYNPEPVSIAHSTKCTLRRLPLSRTQAKKHTRVLYCKQATCRVIICAVIERRVLFELCGVLQQVFICQFPGCCCPFLLKTSHGISWRCHGRDTTSHTHTHVHTLYTYVYVCDTKSYDLQIFITKKKSSCCQKSTCRTVCFGVGATLNPFAESWFLCVCSDVQSHNSPLCRQSEPMCFAVTCGVVVSKWWLRERACLASVSFCLRGSSPLSLYLFFSAFPPPSPHMPVSACTPVCLPHLSVLPLSFCSALSGPPICCPFPFIKLTPFLNAVYPHLSFIPSSVPYNADLFYEVTGILCLRVVRVSFPLWRR